MPWVLGADDRVSAAWVAILVSLCLYHQWSLEEYMTPIFCLHLFLPLATVYHVVTGISLRPPFNSPVLVMSFKEFRQDPEHSAEGRQSITKYHEAPNYLSPTSQSGRQLKGPLVWFTFKRENMICVVSWSLWNSSRFNERDILLVIRIMSECFGHIALSEEHGIRLQGTRLWCWSKGLKSWMRQTYRVVGNHYPEEESMGALLRSWAMGR